MTENELQKECVKYLKEKNILYYHAGFRGLHRAGASKNSVGWPDLFIFPEGGKPKFVELKGPTGNLRPEQIIKIEDLIKAGYETFVVKTYEEFREAMKW